jgi:hypothetical protein
MARKRKVVWTPRPSRGPAPTTPRPATPPTVAVVDARAGLGRSDVSAGTRVAIAGSGPFAGETGVVERVIGGPIPAALVRTASGRSGRVRLVDCAPLRGDDRPGTPAPSDGAAG